MVNIDREIGKDVEDNFNDDVVDKADVMTWS